MPVVIDLKPVRSRLLSYEEFLNLKEEDRSNISQARIISPSLGEGLDSENAFGGMEVLYKNPVYAPRADLFTSVRVRG